MRKHGGMTMAIRALRVAIFIALLLPLRPGAAHADVIFAALFGDTGNSGQILFLAVLVGTVGFAVVSAIALMRARNRAEVDNAELRLRLADLIAATDRAEAIIQGEDQRLVASGPPGEPPLVAGHLSERSGAPVDRAGFLAFGTWLQAESAGPPAPALAPARRPARALPLATAP